VDSDLALAFQLQDAGRALDEAKLALVLKDRAKALGCAREALRCLSGALFVWATARARHRAVKSDPRVNGESGKALYDAQIALEAFADTLVETKP